MTSIAAWCNFWRVKASRAKVGPGFFPKFAEVMSGNKAESGRLIQISGGLLAWILTALSFENDLTFRTGCKHIGPSPRCARE